MVIEELKAKVLIATEAMTEFLQSIGEKYQDEDGLVNLEAMDEDDQATWTFHSIAIRNAQKALWKEQVAQVIRQNPEPAIEDDGDITWFN
jgi:hypothetical protein